MVGGLRGGEAYVNGLLNEINGLQMAQSIYSNETPSLAMSIEQRARVKEVETQTPQVMARPHSKDPSLHLDPAIHQYIYIM